MPRVAAHEMEVVLVPGECLGPRTYPRRCGQHVWTQSRSDRRVESFARAPSRACPPGGGNR